MRPLRWLVLAVALVSLALLAVSGPGTRLGLWEFRTGFVLLRWTVYLGAGAAALALLLLVVQAVRGTPGKGMLALALLLGAGAAYVPWSQYRVARTVPPIHDITTDTAEPPIFVAVLPLRANARNPVEYGGAAVAEQQRKAYPDIVPLHLDVAPPDAFAKALAAAKAMGWEIVDANADAGRIEATATTRWFGFKDDVVVRLKADGAGTRLDVRSLSRVGGSDVGTNARRIREYLARFKP